MLLSASLCEAAVCTTNWFFAKRSLKSDLAGTASIGTVVRPATSLVPMAVAELKRHSPRVLIRIERDHSDVLVSRLLSGALDLAVARVGDTTEASELQFVPPGDEPQCVIARSGHPLARKLGLRIADLADQAWILPPLGTALRVELDAMFLAHGLEPPQNVVEATSLVVALNLLQLSDMLVSLPQVAVRPFCKAGLLTILPVQIGVRMDSFGIITRKGRALSPGAQALLDVLRQRAGLATAGAARFARSSRRN